MLKLDDASRYARTMELMYGPETVRQARALLDGSERFFGLETLGPDFEGIPMHQTLLAAYDKLFA
jgi:ribosomal protein S12 methylthiotransferase accessory factor